MTPHPLPDQWRAKAEAIRPYNPGAAVAFEECARELEAREAAQASKALTIPEAAALSGYSADHLRHKVASGEIPNVGRKHAPRVRAGDLPRKAAPRTPNGYDPMQDALRLLTPKAS